MHYIAEPDENWVIAVQLHMLHSVISQSWMRFFYGLIFDSHFYFIRYQWYQITVFPNLVIYHELRDFGVSLRDRNFPSVRSHESPKSPWF